MKKQLKNTLLAVVFILLSLAIAVLSPVLMSISNNVGVNAGIFYGGIMLEIVRLGLGIAFTLNASGSG